MGNKPLKHQVAVELSTVASRQPRTNPSDPVIRHPFQSAGQVSYHRVQEIPCHLRVSSKTSPAGHPHDDQMLLRLLHVGAYQRAEAYTLRLVQCVQKTGQEKV